MVEVSPVQLLVSENLISNFMHINLDAYPMSSVPIYLKSAETTVLPTRLEALSRLMPYTVNFSIGHLRLSFFTEGQEKSEVSFHAKQCAVEECMQDFLVLVSHFDLNFPHEESLSAAMQVCIDRLAGLGLQIEDSWEAANLVLMNFNEDMAETRTQNISEFLPIHEYLHNSSSDEDYVVLHTIKKSVQRTVALYTDRFLVGSELCSIAEDVVIDLPDGLSLTYVSCFYDHHMDLGIPSLFLTNGAGVHILRMTALEDASMGDYQTASRHQDRRDWASGNNRYQNALAVVFQRFVLDCNHPFGEGGLPISTLESDSGVAYSEKRVQEKLDDLKLGEIELLFSHRIFHDMLISLLQIFSTARYALCNQPITENPGHQTAKDSYGILSVTAATALFFSDDLLPFTRFVVGNLVARSGVMSEQVGSENEASCQPPRQLSVQNLRLFNLTPEGDLYPELIVVLPENAGPCLVVSFYPRKNLLLDLETHGLQVTFLKQYVNECLQYFVSGHYGVGKLLDFLSEYLPHKDTAGSQPFRSEIVFHSCSLILPCSSSSYDLLGIELEKVIILSTHATESFLMPTEDKPLSLGSEVTENCGDIGDPTDTMPRKTVSLRGFRIFSSLPRQIPNGKVLTPDSPSFRYFYKIDGRAQMGKHVYQPVVGPTCSVDGSELEYNAERSKQVWLEVTAKQSSLDVIIDHAPDMRILIFDPSEEGLTGGLEIDVRLSQFCLVLSGWFLNMQELPLMFPFSAAELQHGAQGIYHDLKFPSYGSEAFESFLQAPTSFTSEVGIHLKRLSLRCIFDQNQTDTSECRPDVSSLFLGFERVVIHVTSDAQGVSRISSGSSKGILIDESLVFTNVLEVGGKSACEPWADIHFGLGKNRCSMSEPMPQPFQFTIFITPNWSVYNLGLDAPNTVLSDLWPIFKFLDFIVAYFKDARLGNPTLQAFAQAQQIKEELKGEQFCNLVNDPISSGLEFRLWLVDPSLFIPCDASDKSSPGVRVNGGGGGFWYKYTSLDSLISHEVVSHCLRLIFEDTYVHPEAGDTVKEYGRTLLEQLSLGLRYDTNSSTNHTDISLQIPFVDNTACGLSSPRITVLPTVLSLPTVCTPIKTIERTLGPIVCEMTCIIELLPLTLSALLNFFDGSGDESKSKDIAQMPSSLEDDLSINTVPDKAETIATTSSECNRGISFAALVEDIRIFALDPVLGPHLPVAFVSVSRMAVTASSFVLPKNRTTTNCAPLEDVQISLDGCFWADYFKLGSTRSWEPLIEAYQFTALMEKSHLRGSGISMNSDTDLHINVSSALLVIVDEVVDVFKRLIQETVDTELSTQPEGGEELRCTSDQLTLAENFDGQSIEHQMPTVLVKGSRIAFSMRNLTGQKMRTYQPGPQSLRLTYVDHNEATKLRFSPSISMIKNLAVKEVDYPGLPSGSQGHYANVPAHSIDVQPVGFRWLKRIAADTFGRRFVQLVPRSTILQEKLAKDWQIRNAMNLVVEVGLENGGRQVTFRSILSVVNKTNHNICLLLHPDPSYQPPESAQLSDANETLNNRGEKFGAPCPGSMEMSGDNGNSCFFHLEPGTTAQVPSLMLFASSLGHPGHNLGLMWMKPADCTCNEVGSFLADNHNTTSSFAIDYCSRPVEIASIVKETSSMFAAGSFQNIGHKEARSGIQLSCPVFQSTGLRLAPFCYVVEVGRSPVVKCAHNDAMTGYDENCAMHEPVAYTLSLHPPLILANLLPERGRFELMNAIHQTVVWFGDLEPGQELPVYSVGLDAPLILLINVGFAKTPVGEGVLVHHGADSSHGARGMYLFLSLLYPVPYIAYN